MTTKAGVSRPLELHERARLRELDEAVPRLARVSPRPGAYKGSPARDARSAEFNALRLEVARLLRDGVGAGSLAVALSLSVSRVRLLRKEDVPWQA